MCQGEVSDYEIEELLDADCGESEAEDFDDGEPRNAEPTTGEVDEDGDADFFADGAT